MSKAKKLLILVAILMGLLLIGWLFLRLLIKIVSPLPTNLGVAEGQFFPCPDTPNCVSSQATRSDQYIDPIPYTGELASAQEQLRQLLMARPRTTITVDEPNYLRIETATLVMGFLDDTEFYFDEETHLIHIRGAARLGHSDLGVNRARLESIRQAFSQSKTE